MRVFLVFLSIFYFLSGEVKISKSEKSVLIEVNSPQRGDFDFVIFHNDNPVVIPCRGGECKKQIDLESGENSFEWKDESGNFGSKSLVGGLYELIVFDCKNSRPINEGELLINGKKREIVASKVKIYDGFGQEIRVEPRVRGYISKKEIRVTPKVGKREKICLYPMVKLKKEGAVGDPRFNISWSPSYQDIDVRVITPCGEEIFYRNRKRVCRGFVGRLDIDIKEKECLKKHGSCQENITFDNGGARGEYIVRVQKYKGSNEPTDVTLTILNNGQKRVVDFTLYDVKDEKRFRVIH